MKRDLAEVGGKWRMRVRDGGSGDGSKTTGTGASLTPDYRDKDESNNINLRMNLTSRNSGYSKCIINHWMVTRSQYKAS